MLVIFSSGGAASPKKVGAMRPSQASSQKRGGEDQQPGDPAAGQACVEMLGQRRQVEGQHRQDERIEAQAKKHDVDQEELVVGRTKTHGHVGVEKEAQRAGQQQPPAQRATHRQPEGDRQQRQPQQQRDEVVRLHLGDRADRVPVVETGCVDGHLLAAEAGERVRLAGGWPQPSERGDQCQHENRRDEPFDGG